MTRIWPPDYAPTHAYDGVLWIGIVALFVVAVGVVVAGVLRTVLVRTERRRVGELLRRRRGA